MAGKMLFVNNLTRIDDLSESRWIREQTLSLHVDPGREGNYVAHCVPPVFDAYAKIFHAIYEDTSVDDHHTTWDDHSKQTVVESDDPIEKLIQSSTAIYGGAEPINEDKVRRIRWFDLAVRYRLNFHPEFNVDSFTRNFPTRSWPRYLIGPDEGSLERSTCSEIVRSISALNPEPELIRSCYFLYELIATRDYESDLLFHGPLNAVLETYGLDIVSGTPTYWWPADRSWLICTDWDLTFTLVGGPVELIRVFMENDELEVQTVDPSTRIDYKSDTLNL